MKSDKEIWKESLDKTENADLFKIKSGGSSSRTRKIFRTEEEKRVENKDILLEKRIKILEEQIKRLTEELLKTKRIIKNQNHRIASNEDITKQKRNIE